MFGYFKKCRDQLFRRTYRNRIYVSSMPKNKHMVVVDPVGIVEEKKRLPKSHHAFPYWRRPTRFNVD